MELLPKNRKEILEDGFQSRLREDLDTHSSTDQLTCAVLLSLSFRIGAQFQTPRMSMPLKFFLKFLLKLVNA